MPTPSTPPVPLSIAEKEEDCTAVAEAPSHSEVVSPITPRRSHPAQHGEGFDAPPTLERSGSEHRVGRFPSSSLSGEDRDERWSLL